MLSTADQGLASVLGTSFVANIAQFQCVPKRKRGVQWGVAISQERAFVR
jgi:hypothetical protein